jgi:phage shock protein E
MKSLTWLSLLLLTFSLYSCGDATTTETTDETPEATPTPTANTPDQQDAPYQDLNVAEFREMMEQEGVVILDVRTPQETANGIIEGAIEADFNDRPVFKEFLDNLDPEQTYLVYCRSGRRSAKACQLMAKQKGATKLYNLKGGYLAWEAQADPSKGN